jgi:hypothetical protein
MFVEFEFYHDSGEPSIFLVIFFIIIKKWFIIYKYIILSKVIKNIQVHLHTEFILDGPSGILLHPYSKRFFTVLFAFTCTPCIFKGIYLINIALTNYFYQESCVQA